LAHRKINQADRFGNLGSENELTEETYLYTRDIRHIMHLNFQILEIIFEIQRHKIFCLFER